MIKTLSLLIAIGGTFAIAALALKFQKPAPPAPPIVEPAPSPFAHKIGCRGIIESAEENVMPAPVVPGLVIEVPVHVGDHVQKGAVLFKEDARSSESDYDQQLAQVSLEEKKRAEAEVTFQDKKNKSDRLQSLLASKSVSLEDTERAQYAVSEAQAAAETAQAELQAAKSTLARLQTTIDLLTVTAPRDGTLLQVNIRAGEYASVTRTSDNPLMILGQASILQLRVDVDEENASRVPVQCTGVAYPKGLRTDPIALQFLRIEPYLIAKKSLSSDSTERVDTRVLQVVFRFTPPQFPVYVGQQMDVYINAPEARVDMSLK